MKSRPNDKRDGWYLISPSEAQTFLDTGLKNRSLMDKQVTKICTAIQEGRFRSNGETLIFDNDARLLDGQHRLRACVLANKPVEFYCVFGIPKNFFVSIDDGNRRTAADALYIGGIKNNKLIAAIARHVATYDAAMNPAAYADSGNARLPMTNDDTVRIVKSNKDIEAAAGFVKSLPSFPAISPATLGFVYLMTSRVNPKKAEEFVTKLTSGEGLSSGSPILALRTRLIQEKSKRAKLPKGDLMAFAIKSWRAFVNGHTLSALKFRRGEAMPKFESDDAEEE